jgi:hypothetical protein
MTGSSTGVCESSIARATAGRLRSTKVVGYRTCCVCSTRQIPSTTRPTKLGSRPRHVRDQPFEASVGAKFSSERRCAHRTTTGSVARRPKIAHVANSDARSLLPRSLQKNGPFVGELPPQREASARRRNSIPVRHGMRRFRRLHLETHHAPHGGTNSSQRWGRFCG